MLFEIHEEFERLIRKKITKSKFHIDPVDDILKTKSVIISVSNNFKIEGCS